MVQSWFELESDPGLFTLLVEDFGIAGVQVEEIYDLDTVVDMGSEPLGFIFLFRWIEDRRRRRKLMNENNLCVRDKAILHDIFFAHQVIPNSCATHALLSILLNCEGDTVKLTKELQNLKTSTRGMTPEQKGNAIGSIPHIAEAHNSHASPHLRLQQENKSSVPGASQTGEAYHYVSYLPINGHLYEMDGLKPWPLDHGKFEADWTQKFSDIITERLGGGDIMFNLMAVVPDKRISCRNNLSALKTNWTILSKELQLVLSTWKRLKPDPMSAVIPGNTELTVRQWLELLRTEHNYPLPNVQRIEVQPISPVKPKPVDSNSTTAQIEDMITRLTDMDKDSITEIRVTQEDDSKITYELQELSEFEPIRATHVSVTNADDPSSFTLQELLEMLTDIKSLITDTEQLLKEQEDLRDKYKIDVCRRTHNYYPFITTFLRMLAEQKMLTGMVSQLTQPKKKAAAATPSIASNVNVTLAKKAKKRTIAEVKGKYKKAAAKVKLSKKKK